MEFDNYILPLPMLSFLGRAGASGNYSEDWQMETTPKVENNFRSLKRQPTSVASASVFSFLIAAQPFRSIVRLPTIQWHLE